MSRLAEMYRISCVPTIVPRHCHQRSGEVPGGHALGDRGVLLHLWDQHAPGGDLRPHVAEVGGNRQPQMRIPMQTFQKILTNPLYAGRRCTPKWSLKFEGVFEPLIHQEQEE